MEAGDEIVVFETYSDPVLAHIVRARLEDNGIPSFVDENMSYIYPLYNTAMGGVKLKIFAKDIEKVRALIAEDVGLTVEEFPVDDDTAEDGVTCPHCGSNNVRENVTKNRNISLLGLSISFAAFVPVTVDKAWHCFNCGRDFDEGELHSTTENQ